MKRRQSPPPPPAAADEWVTGKVALSISGMPVEIEMTVPARPVKPRRVLPVLQQITDSFIELALSELEEDEHISCQSGCTACCYQLIPLAESEVYNLAEVIAQMPEARRDEIRQRFADGYEHFRKNGWLEDFNNYPQMSHEEKQQLALDYLIEDIACPFLENESCSIYSERPLSCRVYLVTSPPEYCLNPSGERIKQVHFKARPSIAALEMETTKNMGNALFVPLIAALHYVEKFPDAAREKDGRAWMADFFGNLVSMKNPAN